MNAETEHLKVGHRRPVALQGACPFDVYERALGRSDADVRPCGRLLRPRAKGPVLAGCRDREERLVCFAERLKALAQHRRDRERYERPRQPKRIVPMLLRELHGAFGVGQAAVQVHAGLDQHHRGAQQTGRFDAGVLDGAQQHETCLRARERAFVVLAQHRDQRRPARHERKRARIRVLVNCGAPPSRSSALRGNARQVSSDASATLPSPARFQDRAPERGRARGVGSDPPRRSARPSPEKPVVGLRGPCLKPGQVAVGQLVAFTGLRQLLTRVLGHRREKPPALRRSREHEQALPLQCSKAIVNGRDALGGRSDPVGRFGCEPTREHGETPDQCSLGLIEQAVAPIQRRAQ